MERLITIDELCSILHVTKSTVYSWVYKRRIPFMKLSKGILRFRQNEILRWIEERSFVPVEKELLLRKPAYRRSLHTGPVTSDAVDEIINEVKKEVLSNDSS